MIIIINNNNNDNKYTEYSRLCPLINIGHFFKGNLTVFKKVTISNISISSVIHS